MLYIYYISYQVSLIYYPDPCYSTHNAPFPILRYFLENDRQLFTTFLHEKKDNISCFFSNRVFIEKVAPKIFSGVWEYMYVIDEMEMNCIICT